METSGNYVRCFTHTLTSHVFLNFQTSFAKLPNLKNGFVANVIKLFTVVIFCGNLPRYFNPRNSKVKITTVIYYCIVL